MNFDPSSFNQVVFSGGGTRCFWHGGFLSELGTLADFSPSRVCGVSGGALSGAAWISGNDDRCREVMGDIFARTEHNIELTGEEVTPHQELYREAVSGTLAGDAVEKVASGPEFQILLGCPPSFLPSRLFAAICGMGYKLEQVVTGSPYLRLTRLLGLDAMLVDGRRAAREGKLIDLVCAAATIPPVFDIPKWEGRDVIDGGMVSKAPCPDPDEGRTLVLMTSTYRNIPQSVDKLFVTPSTEVEADKIDFTARGKIEETWEQGRADAKAFLRNFSA